MVISDVPFLRPISPRQTLTMLGGTNTHLAIAALAIAIELAPSAISAGRAYWAPAIHVGLRPVLSAIRTVGGWYAFTADASETSAVTANERSGGVATEQRGARARQAHLSAGQEVLLRWKARAKSVAQN